MLQGILFTACAFFLAGCGSKEFGPRPDEYWRGVHVRVTNCQLAYELIGAIPELAELGVNVIVAEVNYGFCFESHPELRDRDPIDHATARRLTRACRRNGIRLIPQFNCLGHQSWKGYNFPLLAHYPDFDETPGQYPNNEGIFCRSWCPRHPDVNRVIFALIDELIDAFDANAFHVGMDEVFIVASEHCLRCRGNDPGESFARAVNDLHKHLAGEKKVEMLMWGDRLIDANLIDYGMWESSTNGTASSLDQIPKDIIICDWHYEIRDNYPSVDYFQNNGFRVWPACWKDGEAARRFAIHAKNRDRGSVLGMLVTTWEQKPVDLVGFPPVRESAMFWQNKRHPPASGIDSTQQRKSREK